MDRLAIFIDGAYLDRIQKEHFSVHVDLQKLVVMLSSGKPLYRTYYYHCLPYQSRQPTTNEAKRLSGAQKFYHNLDQLNRFQIRLGKLEFRGIDQYGKPIFEQKRVDILLGTDLVLLAAKQHISEAIILAGDSDFLPAIEIAKSEGVLIHLYFYPRSVHRELWNAADERHEINMELINKVKR